jgi:hypothetical protein
VGDDPSEAKRLLTEAAGSEIHAPRKPMPILSGMPPTTRRRSDGQPPPRNDRGECRELGPSP